MTVTGDIEKVHRMLRSTLGSEDAADAWMEERREEFDGKTAYGLIENGRTDEVFDAISNVILEAS